MKQLTLDETWKQCLSMWRWIAEAVKDDYGLSVFDLKRLWMKDHGYGHVKADCFFCQFNFQSGGGCKHCPGKLVDPDFDCEDLDYLWSWEPIAFYNKIVSLNKQRKAPE